MSLLVQLSDLHLLGDREGQPALLDALVRALDGERRRRERPADLLVVTGDVFDSSSLPAAEAIAAFRDLHGRVREALGRPDLPTVVVPGNHDRRRMGIFGPHDQALFDALAEATVGEAFVHGSRVPFLSEVVPPELHGLPLWLVVFDSTYLPHGWLSAGGALRQEDLLHAASVIGRREPSWPVVFLLHHHLVPTPLTDVGIIDPSGTSRLVRWGVEHLLPRLVANGDREELTMTALGSGTALSTLHTMGRAVVVLHGHKHYATARLLRGVEADQGDVMLVSAGSAGTAQPWYPTTSREAARLWPSFNVVELGDQGLAVDIISFGYDDSRGNVVVRPMVRAGREDARWLLRPVTGDVHKRGEAGPRLASNELTCRLEPGSSGPPGARWDIVADRRFDGEPDRTPAAFSDTVDALEDGTLTVLSGPKPEDVGSRPGVVEGGAGAPPDDDGDDGVAEGLPSSRLPTEVELVRGVPFRYRIDGGVCRTTGEAARLFGARHTPYAWLGLMNRYPCGRARLVVRAPTGTLKDAFASETDLGNGLERPISVTAGSTEDGQDEIVLEYERCPPRTLLRVYWRLAPEPPR